MKKTAVVYDKWLNSMGGGEVVACSIAKALSENGYEVTFISGKYIDPREIRIKLGIDVSEISFKQVWNDELSIKELTENKDLFINITYMDYTFGFAKKNIFYTHFPTVAYVNLRGLIFNRFVLPLASSIIKPLEFMDDTNKLTINRHLAYLLVKRHKLSFSFLQKGEQYLLKFILFYETFEKSLLEDMEISLEGAEVIKISTKVNHNYNTITYAYRIVPQKSTIYVNFVRKGKNANPIYLIGPKILRSYGMTLFLYTKIREYIQTRLRAGLFVNIVKRLDSYQLIFAHSKFVQNYISKYWHKESVVLYPPVTLINASNVVKKKYICSVGRFFTLGHGKKQEVMIEAFKKLYDSGINDWELHLIGGVGTEPTTLIYVKMLETLAAGYPIFFHFNSTREFVEKCLSESKIYWHAAGYGENEDKNPVKFEHFGIAPVEALSAGCALVLYNGGGLREIIELCGKKNNYLFNNIEELVRHTKYMIEKNDFKNENYDFCNSHFSKDVFGKKFIKLVDSLK